MIPPPSTTATLVSFAQDAPQPLAYPLVQRLERRPVAVLEVSHPAPQAAVDFVDDVLHRTGARALGLGPECVLQLVQALLARPSVASLEVVAQKVEASWLTGIDDAGLGARPFLRLDFPPEGCPTVCVPCCPVSVSRPVGRAAVDIPHFGVCPARLAAVGPFARHSADSVGRRACAGSCCGPYWPPRFACFPSSILYSSCFTICLP